MKSAFIKIFLGILFVAAPVQASMKAEADEEKSMLSQTGQALVHTSQSGTLPSVSSNEDTTLDVVPDELYLLTFRFLAPQDLGRTTQVSTRWKKLTDTPDLWRYMGAKYYGDYLSEEDLKTDPKTQVVFHYLSVIVNATENLNVIERLVSHYRLALYAPLCKKYLGPLILTDLVSDISCQKELIAQGSQGVVKRYS